MLLVSPQDGNRIADTLCRQNLSFFIERAFTTVEPKGYVHNWHIDCIAEYLHAVQQRKLNRLIINVPPGYTKSVAVNVAFSAYCLGMDPTDRILSASHSYDLSVKMSNKTKQIIMSSWYQRMFPAVRLRKDVENRQDFYKTTKNGFRMAVSVGGKVTGDGGDRLIIDDPLDANDLGDNGLEKCNNWFDGTFYSRLRDKKTGTIVVIMQRLHEKDLCGHLLSSELDKYEQCIIPGIEDTHGGKVYSYGKFRYERNEGELLCDKIEGKKEIDKARERMGAYGFAGQYQQKPAPLEGGYIKRDWFKKWAQGEPPPVDYVLQSWDTALSEKKSASYTACTTWGVFKDDHDIPNILLLGSFRKRMEFPELYDAVGRMSQDYGALTPDIKINKDRQPDIILIEDKSSGKVLVQLISKTGANLVAFNPDKYGDKTQRVRSTTHIMEAGRIWVPTFAPSFERLKPHADDLVNQAAMFPNSESRDYVDSMTQALLYLIKNGWVYHPSDADAQLMDQPKFPKSYY